MDRRRVGSPSVDIRLGDDLLVDLDRFEEGLSGLGSFIRFNVVLSNMPELLDDTDAPFGAIAGCPDRFGIDRHEDRIGVHLGITPQCDPTAAGWGVFELDVVQFLVRRNSLARDGLTVHNQFDQPRLRRGLPTSDGCPERHVLVECDFGLDREFAAGWDIDRIAEFARADLEAKTMGITIGDIGSSGRDSLAERAVVDHLDLTQMDIHAPLTDAAAGDAGEIGLAGHFQREPAIQNLVPAVPLRDAIGIHGTDEIADTQCGRHADFLSPNAVHVGDQQIR